MRLNQDVELIADLTLSAGDTTASLAASGRDLRLRFESVTGAIAWWRRLRRGGFYVLLPALERWGTLGESTLTVEVGRNVVAIWSDRERGGRVADLLGVAPLRIRWWGLGRSVVTGWRRR